MDVAASNAGSLEFASVAREPRDTPRDSLKCTGPAGVPLTGCFHGYVPCSRCSMTEIEWMVLKIRYVSGLSRVADGLFALAIFRSA